MIVGVVWIEVAFACDMTQSVVAAPTSSPDYLIVAAYAACPLKNVSSYITQSITIVAKAADNGCSMWMFRAKIISKIIIRLCRETIGKATIEVGYCLPFPFGW